MKVLVVEDEPGVRASLVELIQELGYEASAVGSVADARDALTRGAPDVCITDLGLPDGSGLDVVRAAKAARPDSAVLVLTGKGSILAAVEAMRAGARGSARGDGRPIAGDAGSLPPDRPRGGLRSTRDDHRGERHGQGGRGPYRTRALAPHSGAVRRGQLRRDLADPRRERALRA